MGLEGLESGSRLFRGSFRVEDSAGVKYGERHLPPTLHTDTAHHDEILALPLGCLRPRRQHALRPALVDVGRRVQAGCIEGGDCLRDRELGVEQRLM